MHCAPIGRPIGHASAGYVTAGSCGAGKVRGESQSDCIVNDRVLGARAAQEQRLLMRGGQPQEKESSGADDYYGGPSTQPEGGYWLELVSQNG